MCVTHKHIITKQYLITFNYGNVTMLVISHSQKQNQH